MKSFKAKCIQAFQMGKELGSKVMNKKGEGMIVAYILLGVAVIIAVGVVVPIISQTVANASLSGIDALIAGFLTTLLLVGLLLQIVYVSIGK